MMDETTDEEEMSVAECSSRQRCLSRKASKYGMDTPLCVLFLDWFGVCCCVCVCGGNG